MIGCPKHKWWAWDSARQIAKKDISGMHALSFKEEFLLNMK